MSIIIVSPNNAPPCPPNPNTPPHRRPNHGPHKHDQHQFNNNEKSNKQGPLISVSKATSLGGWFGITYGVVTALPLIAASLLVSKKTGPVARDQALKDISEKVFGKGIALDKYSLATAVTSNILLKGLSGALMGGFMGWAVNASQNKNR